MSPGEGETGQSPGMVLGFAVWTDLLRWLGLALSPMAARVWGGWVNHFGPCNADRAYEVSPF